MKLPRPARNERTVLIGRTGSGKTVLARVLCEPFPYVVVLDAKGRIDWPGYVRCTTLQELANASQQFPRLIYAPIPTELYDSKGRTDLMKIDRFFQGVFRRGNTALYIDEVTLITVRDQMPPHYRYCIQQGRELGIQLFSATQRPTLVPPPVMSEAENWYTFITVWPSDKDRIARVTGIDRDRLDEMKPYEFYYSRPDGLKHGPLRLPDSVVQ